LPRLALDPHYVRLFMAEAELSCRLHHPSIVEVYEAGAAEAQLYMAMEYVDGRDLGMVLRRCHERRILLPLDFAVYLGVTLLEALSYAHVAPGPDGSPLGIVHCDVSPSNLFVSRVGEIKLGDFGIARAISGEPKRGSLYGKVYYLSPEALEGKIDRRADLWAASVTLYQLLANERPFSGRSPEEVAQAIRHGQPAPLRQRRPEIPEALDRAVMRGFSLEPAERYPNAAHFALALKPHYDERVGTPLAIAAVVRGLFGT
jgi:eukaryotic-like serine/threonine-protein kinase